MKTPRLLVTGLALAVALSMSLNLRAQDTAFSYQGRLAQNGSPFSGFTEMQFTLFDVPADGTAIATNATPVANIDVSNGLFATVLDFGAGAFSGGARWLEIAVRTNGTSAFVRLAPRQQIASTPYAMTARVVTGGVAADQLIGTIRTANIGAGTIHSNHLALGSIHSNLLAVGAIHSNHLARASIHSNHFALGSIHSNHLSVGAIHSNHFALGSIHSNHLAVGAIHSNHLAARSIHSNALALGSVTAAALATGSIHSNHLAAGSVHSNAMVIGAIHSNHLAVGAIHSNHLVLGAIHSNHLAVGAIHSNHIARGSIHSNLLAVGAVNSTHLGVGAIHSNHLAQGAVTLNTLRTGLSGSFSRSLNNPNPNFASFGSAVAAVGTDHVIVGANQDSNAGDNVGAALLFDASGGFVRTFQKPVPQNQDRFGIAVAAVGEDKVLIGADSDDAGAFDAGAAYLFSINGTLITTYTNPTPASGDFFGYSVAAVGTDKVLIGAYGDHFGANVGGAAYLFTTNRTLLATFNNPSPAGGDRFGIAVAAVGADRVLIGADRDDAGVTDSGVAYLFHINGTLLTTITNPTPALNDAFGFAVASVGADSVLVGAYGDNSAGNAGGAAYLFNTSGALLTTFANPTPSSGDQFGVAVAAAGTDKVLIAADRDDAGATDAGTAYVFNLAGGLVSTFNNPAPANGDLFGSAVAALGADRMVVGAAQDTGGSPSSGAVHLFSLNAYVPGLTLDPSLSTWQKSGSSIFYNSGNVGIGTSNPEYKLDVAGAVRISNFGHGTEVLNLSTERSWAFRQLGTGAGTALELASIGGGGNKNFVINTTGLVGIGTVNPQAVLQVSGNNSHLRLHDTGRGNYWNIYTENHPSQATSGNLLFVPGPAGTFGYIQKSTGNYFSGSDERLKEDINCLSSVLDRVLKLRPVSYRFKSAPASVQPALGFIAQEVEPLFPEVVDEQGGFKSLSYSALVPVTVGAIQELNEKLERKLQQKETEIAELKKSVAELKELVGQLAVLQNAPSIASPLPTTGAPKKEKSTVPAGMDY